MSNLSFDKSPSFPPSSLYFNVYAATAFLLRPLRNKRQSIHVGHPVLFFPSPAAARGRDPSRGCFQSQRGTEEEERQTTFLSRSHISKRPIPRLELRKLSCVPPLLDRQMFSRVGIHPTRSDNNKSWRRIGPLGEIYLFGRGEAEEGKRKWTCSTRSRMMRQPWQSLRGGNGQRLAFPIYVSLISSTSTRSQTGTPAPPSPPSHDSRS